jgi:hypothetical protein
LLYCIQALSTPIHLCSIQHVSNYVPNHVPKDSVAGTNTNTLMPPKAVPTQT